MNLYHVSQDVNDYNYDTYSDMVVCCETEEEARWMNPRTGVWTTLEDLEYLDMVWAHPNKLTIKYIGEADSSVEKGIVCSSFHAG